MASKEGGAETIGRFMPGLGTETNADGRGGAPAGSGANGFCLVSAGGSGRFFVVVA